MSSSFELEPERFVPGCVGEPGARVFYLQAVEATQVVSLRLEKQQVAALAEYLAGILADLSPVDPQPLDDVALVDPVIAEWVVGSLAVAYEESSDRLLIVAEELVEVDDETGIAEHTPSTARFHVTRAQVDVFIRRAVELVQAGRPLCPICGRPINPDGHVCPRGNGQSSH
jgi:uncharacterized repeat protein (TIGR03847 family)